ncbi:MAG: transglutaminase family protein [Polyangiaceae bacterium]
MNRRALLLALGTCACRGAPAPALTFAREVLSVAREAGEANTAEEQASLAELTRIVALAQQALYRAPQAVPDSVLSTLLFGTLGFAREVTDTNLRFVLLPGVLRERRGSCVGLGTLFLALSEALGWAGNGVMMPGHFYVRLHNPGNPGEPTRNVELLHQGESLPNSWYMGRFPIPTGGEREYGRPLSTQETLGVLQFDVGNERRRQHRLPEARRAYASATALFPEFAEAHASLGATLHVLGDLNAAAASYQRAQQLNPDLEGVAKNFALLERERGGPF